MRFCLHEEEDGPKAKLFQHPQMSLPLWHTFPGRVQIKFLQTSMHITWRILKHYSFEKKSHSSSKKDKKSGKCLTAPAAKTVSIKPFWQYSTLKHKLFDNILHLNTNSLTNILPWNTNPFDNILHWNTSSSTISYI